MPKVVMYCTEVCPFCIRAEQLLVSKNASVTKIRVDLDPPRREEMIQKTGRRTVPQIFIGNTHVGGFDDLSALNNRGGLDPLLAG